jgi:superoxide dismutase, Cu-Zn family
MNTADCGHDNQEVVMRGIAVLMAVAVLVACERRPDVPPAQPMEGAAPDAPVMPADQGIAPGAPSNGVVVQMIGTDGEPVGGARIEETTGGVMISIRVTGLQPGRQHGFHIHERGECQPPDFQSAGGHFAPQDRQHGFENPQGPHAGDLPNLRANQEGVADTSFVAPSVRLTSAVAEGLLRPGGTALVVHAQPDDYRTDPSGESGARIACGVIRGGA